MLFHYKRTRRRQALTVAFNIMLLPILLYVFEQIAKDHNNFEELYANAVRIFIAIGIVLVGTMVWFLRSKAKFELYVTEDEFFSNHPLFKEWCFSVSPKDVKEIKHSYSLGSEMTSIDMIMENGESHQICKNYDYSRKSLYDALKLANPEITLPDNFNRFKSEPSKETDEYVSRRFPITTKIFKWLLRIKPNKSN